MESYSHWRASTLTCASTGKRFAVEPTTRGEKVSLFPARCRSAANIFPEIAQVRFLSSYTFTRNYLVRLCSCQSVLGNLHLRVNA